MLFLFSHRTVIVGIQLIYSLFPQLTEIYLNKIISNKKKKAIYLKIFFAVLVVIVKDGNNLDIQRYRNYYINSDIQK